MYKLIKGFQNSIGLIKNKEDGSFMAIPTDPANTDYQAYLKWVAEGNVPLAAETTTPEPAESQPTGENTEGAE